MNNLYTAVIKQEDDCWIGWIEEYQELIARKITRRIIETLKVTLEEALEFNRQDAITAAGSNYYEEQIAL